jgi:mono/diheme cytochrome c family protein
VKRILETSTKPRIVTHAVLTALLVAGAGLAQAGELELNGNAAAGQPLYQLQCASCHGVSGKGDGPAARAFNPPPSNLVREDLSGERMFIATRDGGMAVGLAATMPSFRHSLSDESIHDIVAYLKSLRD